MFFSHDVDALTFECFFWGETLREANYSASKLQTVEAKPARRIQWYILPTN